MMLRLEVVEYSVESKESECNEEKYERPIAARATKEHAQGSSTRFGTGTPFGFPVKKHSVGFCRTGNKRGARKHDLSTTHTHELDVKASIAKRSARHYR